MSLSFFRDKIFSFEIQRCIVLVCITLSYNFFFFVWCNRSTVEICYPRLLIEQVTMTNFPHWFNWFPYLFSSTKKSMEQEESALQKISGVNKAPFATCFPLHINCMLRLFSYDLHYLITLYFLKVTYKYTTFSHTVCSFFTWRGSQEYIIFCLLMGSSVCKWLFSKKIISIFHQ